MVCVGTLTTALDSSGGMGAYRSIYEAEGDLVVLINVRQYLAS